MAVNAALDQTNGVIWTIGDIPPQRADRGRRSFYSNLDDNDGQTPGWRSAVRDRGHVQPATYDEVGRLIGAFGANNRRCEDWVLSGPALVREPVAG